MTYRDLRKAFIEFFKEKDHIEVPSSSIIPEHDASVLFTAAGMQQFKPYYTGKASPYGNKILSIQKCFRTSDIDEVGDETHLTFFEMLGNFAFEGEVSKEEAIKFGWEFLTSPKWMDIETDRIMASYYNGNRIGTFEDKEAKKILESLKNKGLTEILPQTDEDNFWGPTGNTGPCGPTVEFYVDGVEIWNIVFNEYYCNEDKSLTPSTNGLGIDTGMGMERLLTAVTPEANNVYDIELFSNIIERIHDHTPELDIGTDRSVRVIADHLRGSVFLLADKIQPSNKEQGYVLRRILRRAILHLDKLGALSGFEEIINIIIEYYGEFYSELVGKRDNILQFATLERDKFLKTIAQGKKELQKVIADAVDSKISGEAAFDLFATYGLPLDFIKEEAIKQNLTIDEAGFEKAFKKHQEVSRAGVDEKFGGHGLASGAEVTDEDKTKITRYHTATHLLHAALIKFLGNDVKQAGSDLNTERLRFDFTYPRALTSEEKEQIETWVNEQIQKSYEVIHEDMPLSDALDSGALSFFREKYPDPVTVYSIYNKDGDKVVSCELCGGPHVTNTSEIGKFKITKEQSSSAGVRRIKAVLE
ncbi:MAG: alanine--tRNA ligase [Patescibacteria group bacterium]|nr:alanine--tRNA ligase [Patescibacteria group bacterium]